MLIEPREPNDPAERLRALADDAVREIVMIWHHRASNRSFLRSKLSGLGKEKNDLIDPRLISDHRAWMLSVEIAGRRASQAVGFDVMPVLYAFHSKPRPPIGDIARAMGWPLRSVRRRVGAASAAFFLELATRGITRRTDDREEPFSAEC